MNPLVALLSLQLLIACSASNKLSSLGHEDCAAQYDTLSNQKVYVYVDQMPEYPGGNQALMKYFLENFRYPEQASFQATFLVEFVIDADGKLIAPRIKGKSELALTEVEKEVLKVMRSAPKWKSGACNGKHVPVKIFLPLNF